MSLPKRLHFLSSAADVVSSIDIRIIGHARIGITNQKFRYMSQSFMRNGTGICDSIISAILFPKCTHGLQTFARSVQQAENL